MRLKRWFCVLLTLCMAITVLPLSAVRALEVPKNAVTSEWNDIPFQVNPLYEGLIDPADYAVEFTEKDRELSTSATVTYLSEKEAAAKIRANMKNRVGEFTIYVESGNDRYYEVLEGLMGEALKHTGNPKEGDSLQWQFAGYSGDAATEHVAAGKYHYTFNLVIPYYTTASQEKELDTAVKNLLNKLNLSGKSDYEKVKAVYDYVCKNVAYDYDHLNDTSYTLQFTPYAALIKKTAVCQGYALLMYRLMLELDVDIRLIAGLGGDEAHGWNIVKLDGLYYNLDSTWDAGVDEYMFFLLNRENFLYHYRYMDYETFEFHKAYPMADSNYKKGTTAKVDPLILEAYCSENIIFSLNRNGTLTISGTGAMPDYASFDYTGDIAPWRYWEEDLTQIVVNKGVTEIGEYCFYSMDNVKELSLPEGLTEIGEYAFNGCNSLKNLTLPSSLKSIAFRAFEDCSALTNVKIPDGVESIESNAFGNCRALVEVTIPASVTYLNGFSGCSGLKTVYLNNTGVVASGAFQSCYELSKLVISNNVTEIKSSAFSDCFSLTEVTIPASVTNIGSSCFSKCRELVSVYLNNSGTIGSRAFSYCYKLSNVVISGNVTTIESMVFEDCQALTEIVLPASLESMEGDVFRNCAALKTISFLGDAPTMKYDTFEGITATAYYPVYNETWTPDVLQNYGGDITWVPTCYDNHIYDEGTVTLQPGCTTNGTMTYTCINCEKTRTEAIPATGHTSESSYVETEPTCMTLGVMVHVCAVCHEQYFEDIPRLPHTCEDGICTACGNSVFRLSGKGRCETALLAAEELKGTLGVEKFDAIIIASGNNFADALAGSYLAAVKGAPILLSYGKAEKDADQYVNNIAYIKNNLAEGGTVYILGGTAAVPGLYEEGLEGIHVERLTGKSRFETNIEILQEAGIDANAEILVSTGWNYADSLSASATGKPILLLDTKNGKLSESQTAFLSELQEKNCTFTIIGGTGAVSAELETALEAYGNVDRISGKTRYETSVKVAEAYFVSPESAVLAYGRNFPDGLCGGALAFSMNAPLILTQTGVEAAAADYIQAQAIEKGIVLGGTGLISDDAVRTVFAMNAPVPVK